jgi:hypothetical protein
VDRTQFVRATKKSLADEKNEGAVV